MYKCFQYDYQWTSCSIWIQLWDRCCMIILMLAESDLYSFTYKNHPLARTFHSNIETQRQNRNIQCISRNEERQNCKTTSTCHKYYTSKKCYKWKYNLCVCFCGYMCECVTATISVLWKKHFFKKKKFNFDKENWKIFYLAHVCRAFTQNKPDWHTS